MSCRKMHRLSVIFNRTRRDREPWIPINFGPLTRIKVDVSFEGIRYRDDTPGFSSHIFVTGEVHQARILGRIWEHFLFLV